MQWYKTHECWAFELKSHLEPCLLLGSWESETDYQHHQHGPFNPPQWTSQTPNFPRPQMVPLPLANWPGKASCDFTGGWGMELSKNQQKSTYIRDQCQLIQNCASQQVIFGISCWGHIACLCARTHKHTRTQEPFILDKIHQTRTYEDPGGNPRWVCQWDHPYTDGIMLNMYPPGEIELFYRSSSLKKYSLSIV